MDNTRIQRNSGLFDDFEDSIFEAPESSEIPGDTFSNFSTLLNELNEQVNSADGSVGELVKQRDNIDRQKKELTEYKTTLEKERNNFEQMMKEEYQKLNDAKAEFEAEKTRTFDNIQLAREDLAKKQRDFEKYRREQLTAMEKGKKTLTKNFEQFEKIVATFNSKIDKYSGNKDN